MRRVPGTYNIWEYSGTLPGNPAKDRYEYKYGFCEKGHDFTVPLFGRVALLSRGSSYCQESRKRQMRSGAHFDVFHFSDDESYVSDTIPKGVIIFLQWLRSFVFAATISHTLIQLENFPFTLLSGKYVDECLNFIVNCALECTVTDIQRFYLCIVLSHLVSSDSIPLAFQNHDENRAAEACDRLLQCLSTCANSTILPIAILSRLRTIALILVKNSNSPGWLTFAVHFYPYFGPEFVSNEEYTAALKYSYDGNEYKKMVAALFLHMKRKNGNDKAKNKHLLQLVLEHAHNLDAAWYIFEIANLSWFFHSEEEKERFLVNFYQQNTEDSSAKKKTVCSKLTEFYNIPKEIRKNMHKILIPILLQFAKSDEALNDEHAKIFLELIISKDLSVDQLFQVFMELSKSKSVRRQDLLLTVLDNEVFDVNWRDADLAEKLFICKTWVKERTVNVICETGLDGVRKIVTAYEAINAIIQCSLNISNKMLANHLSTFAVEGILKGVDVISFIRAFGDLEKCAAVVQECYKSDLKKILVKATKEVKKSREFLRECSRSRYSSCISLTTFYNKLFTRSQNLYCLGNETYFPSVFLRLVLLYVNCICSYICLLTFNFAVLFLNVLFSPSFSLVLNCDQKFLVN